MSNSCSPLDYSLPGSSVHRVLQARMLEWVAISFSRGSFPPRDWTCISYTFTKISFLATNIKTRLLNVQRCNSIWAKRNPIRFLLQTRATLAFLGPLVLPHWPSGKESACNAGYSGEVGWIPGWGRAPGEGNGNPLQYSCLSNPTDRGACRATFHGVAKELDVTEHACSTHDGPLV